MNYERDIARSQASVKLSTQFTRESREDRTRDLTIVSSLKHKE